MTSSIVPQLSARIPRRQQGVRAVPGFFLSAGIAWSYVAFMVLVPVAALGIFIARSPTEAMLRAVSDPRTHSALWVSFGMAISAAAASIPLGLLIAWVLVRFELPGRRVLDAAIDLPFALPTAVSGIALTTIWSPKGWLGPFFHQIGIDVAFTRLGILIALVFVSLPFVVRSVQPVLEDLPPELEEAAACLGADRVQTFLRVVLPALRPALLAGASLGFGRSVGEFGSIIFIAGNIPGKTEIAPLLILIRLEEYDYAGAAAIGAVMLLGSLIVIFALNVAARRLARRAR